MLISGAIFADIGLENFSLRLLKSPDACSCDYDVVNSVCLVFFFSSRWNCLFKYILCAYAISGFRWMKLRW